MTEDRERVYWWSHAEEEQPLWRHGRAHLIVPARGTRNLYPGGAHLRQDLTFGAEWRLLILRSNRTGPFGFGWQAKWGTNSSETTPDFSIHLSRLGDLWVHFGGVLPYRWLERHNPDGTVDYDSRTFGITADGRGFRWECWQRAHHWSRSDPWWMSQSYEWRRLFFGAEDTTEEIVAEGSTLIPMPERNYPATWWTKRYERHHQKPLGRLRDRLLGARFHYGTKVEPGKPVPVPGKGENSWDCGDDAIYSMHTGGRNVEKVVAAIVESALRDRRRYGGQDMSVPEPAE